MVSLALIALDEGKHEEALALASEAWRLSRERGYRHIEPQALVILAGCALARGDNAVARDYLGASIAISQEVGHVATVGQILERFVELAAVQGRLDGAVRIAASATALRVRSGSARDRRSQDKIDDVLASARRTLGNAAVDEAWQAGYGLGLDEAVADALALTELTPEALGTPPPRTADSPLTRRETEVAVLIARGLTNRQIADRLVITEGTAASHVAHILNKLTFQNRVQVAGWAFEAGLVAGADGL